MKKFLLLILVAMTAFGVNAQTRKGEGFNGKPWLPD